MVRKVKFFKSHEDYSEWADGMQESTGYIPDEVVTYIDDGWRISIDLMTECAKASTALRRLTEAVRGINSYVDGWLEEMKEAMENGFFSNHDRSDDGHVWGYGIESIDDNRYYVYLTITGVYAGREE